MKITRVESIVLQTTIEPFGYSQLWYDKRGASLVRISTDEGITGWGECYGPGECHKGIIETLFAPMLVGKDPTDVGVLWEYMYNRSRDYGQKGVLVSALSGIDIALWDIFGKWLGQPICKLIGGVRRDTIKAYATGMYFKKTDDPAGALAAEAERYVKMGFSAVKMKLGQGEDTDIACVRAVRKAIGPDIRLMVDANHAFNSTRALRMANAIADQNIHWFEEPVPPEDIDGYVEVKARSPIPVAGGECEFTRFGFKELLSRRAVDYVQPDTCTTGGISEALKIITLASIYNVQYMPHVWGSSIALATALHVLAALPDFPLSLDPTEPMLEFDRTENPFRTFLSREPIEQKNGYVDVPMGPGLGIDIDEGIIERYRIA